MTEGSWLGALATGTGLVVLGGLALFVLARVAGALGALPRLDVKGRWVVVTGCDSGIGQGVVAALVARGARVIACCFSEAGAAAALSAGAALAPRLDLTDEAAVTATARDITQACGGVLWALVHNAGAVLPGFVDYQPLSSYQRLMAVNFYAPVQLTKALLPCLRRARGRVVVVSSVDGIVSLPGNAPYDASKFALEAWADALRTELSFWAVHVSVVNPATLRTPLAMRFFEAHRPAWEAAAQEEPAAEWQRAYPREWLDEYVRVNTENLQRIAQDPRHAVSDVVHAVTAARPRLRYLSGTLAKTLFYLLWVGPEAWAARFKRALIAPAPRVD